MAATSRKKHWWEDTSKWFSWGQNGALDLHLMHLYGDDIAHDPEKRCKCAWAFGPAGKLHGVDMGNGWARVTTHPTCPHHGTAAEKARKERQRPKARR